MRNFTRVLALVLSIVMLCGVIAMHANAAEAGDYTEAANRLAAVGILKGDTSGNLMLNNEVKRWHTALFFMQIMTGITDAAELNAVKESSVFTDVPEYGTAIDQAYGFGVVRGRGNGIYGYNDNIIYQDMLVMAVRALGYETEDMSYPYGHITAAQKLGITKNIASDVLYTDALTRGETSQIMWNTLNIEIAYEDPISGKIIYPGEAIPTESIFNKEDREFKIERETYLERSKFAQGSLNLVITDFEEGKLSTDMDILTVDYYYNESDVFGVRTDVEINAKDLGITKYTDKCEYLGLPITIYVDCKASEFDSKYNVDAELSEAKIVLTEAPQLTNVQNLAANGNIKYFPAVDDKADYFVIDGKKFASDKYTIDTRIFTEDGWVDDEGLMSENFLYDSKEGYIGKNSYGEINYAVITEEVLDETQTTLLILYMPYSFGLYQMRNIIYSPVSSALDLVTIGVYERNPAGYENKDGVLTNFVEYTLGAGRTVIDNTKDLSVNQKEGEKSVNVMITGSEVASGEFIFYNYNEVDNILTVGLTCGTLQQSRLTGFSDKKETVKIGGTSYDYGFPGAFTSNLPLFSEIDFDATFIDALEAGKNNVAYAVVGDNVVFAIEPLEKVEVNHSYAILSIKPEVMADALGISESDYMKKTTEIVIDRSTKYDLLIEDGMLKVAALDTSSGEWYIQAITDIDTGEYTLETDEFEKRENLADHIKGYKMVSTNYKNLADFAAVLPVLNEGLVMLREANKDGIVIAAVVDEAIDYGTTTTGLAFSDLKPYTNKIKATKKTTTNESRRTLKDSSVIVIIDNQGNVGVRKGIQTTANNAYANSGRFYTTTNDLIVLKLMPKASEGKYEYDGNLVFDVAGNRPKDGNFYGTDGISVIDWAESLASSESSETYYVTTGASELTLENNGDKDETYTVTVTNVFDLREFKKVATVETIVSKAKADALDTAFAANASDGLVLHLDNKGEISVATGTVEENLVKAADLYSDTDEDFLSIDITAIEDEVSIAATLGSTTLTTDEAVGSIDIILATINLSSADKGDYDFTGMAYPVEYSKDKYKEDGFGYLKGVSSVKYDADTSYYLYSISNIDDTASVSEPASGKFSNYVINTEGQKLFVPAVDDDYFENAKEVTIEIEACGQFDETSGTLTVYMLKFIKDYAE